MHANIVHAWLQMGAAYYHVSIHSKRGLIITDPSNSDYRLTFIQTVGLLLQPHTATQSGSSGSGTKGIIGLYAPTIKPVIEETRRQHASYENVSLADSSTTCHSVYCLHLTLLAAVALALAC